MRMLCKLLAIASVAASATIFAAAGQAAPRIAINDTGLRTCLDRHLEVTGDCQGTGQDAESGRDVTHNADGDGEAGFSYARICHSGERAGQGGCPLQPALGPDANQWGCTRDRVTGLMWEIKTGGRGPRSMDLTYTHYGDGRPEDASAFVAWVNARGLCGYRDWRLPTRFELLDLVDYAAAEGPLIDAAYFPNTNGDFHLTSTPLAGYESYHWLVDFDEGLATAPYYYARGPVRLVRGRPAAEAAPENARFVARGGEVLDQLTGLIWKRCTEGQRWTRQTCWGPTPGYPWFEAMEHAQEVAAATGLAWRVPSVKELATLVDASRDFPAIHAEVFPITQPAPYWTSTYQKDGSQTYAYLVEFDLGRVSGPFLSLSTRRLLRLVRDGP